MNNLDLSNYDDVSLFQVIINCSDRVNAGLLLTLNELEQERIWGLISKGHKYILLIEMEGMFPIIKKTDLDEYVNKFISKTEELLKMGRIIMRKY